MNLPTSIPLTVAPDAVDHITSLGMQAEFEQMLEHAVQTLLGLRSIEVTLEPPYDTGDEDRVLITPRIDRTVCPDRQAVWKEWTTWEITTFSPDVLRHFCFFLF